MHRSFIKHWRYFPIPFGIRESFHEIAAWRKMVKGGNLKFKGGFSHLPIARLVLSFSAYFTQFWANCLN